MLPMLAEVGRFFPAPFAAKDAPCKAEGYPAGENFSVLDFPVLQCWPLDGGRFITLALRNYPRPEEAENATAEHVHAMQVYDGQTTGMHWQRQKKMAAEHLRDRLRAAASRGCFRRCKAPRACE